MAGKTSGDKSPTKEKADSGAQSGPGLAGGPGPSDPGDLEIEEVDFFSNLFGDGTEAVTVELYRDQPTQFAGQDVGGFLCNLSPGANLQSVKDQCGGGSFHVIKRGDSGRFLTRRHFRIAGFPVAVPPTSSVPVPDGGAQNESGDESDAQWERRVSRLMATKALLEPPGNFGSILEKVIPLIMPAMVERLFAPAEDALGQMAKIKDLMDTFRNDSPVQTDNPWVMALGKLADVLTAKGGHAAPAPASAPSAPVPQIESRSAQIERAPAMDFQQLAKVAVETIGNGFLTDPRIEPVDLIPILGIQLAVDTSPGLRDGIRPHKETFWKMVQLYISGLLEGQSEWGQELRTYFDAVFDGFCSPDLIKEETGGEIGTDGGAGGPKDLSANDESQSDPQAGGGNPAGG